MSEQSAVRQVATSLGTDFVVEPGMEEDVCVDLEGEGREDSLVSAHPDLDIPNLEFVSGSVGEGGDHVNVTFKNTGEQAVTLDRDRVVLIVREVSEAEKPESNEGVEKSKEDTETVEKHQECPRCQHSAGGELPAGHR